MIGPSVARDAPPRTARRDPRLRPCAGRPMVDRCVKVPPGSSPRLPAGEVGSARGRWCDRSAAFGRRSPLTSVHQGARCVVSHPVRRVLSCPERSCSGLWSVTPASEGPMFSRLARLQGASPGDSGSCANTVGGNVSPSQRAVQSLGRGAPCRASRGRGCCADVYGRRSRRV
jgi:hypothetical protein